MLGACCLSPPTHPVSPNAPQLGPQPSTDPSHFAAGDYHHHHDDSAAQEWGTGDVGGAGGGQGGRGMTPLAFMKARNWFGTSASVSLARCADPRPRYSFIGTNCQGSTAGHARGETPLWRTATHVVRHWEDPASPSHSDPRVTSSPTPRASFGTGPSPGRGPWRRPACGVRRRRRAAPSARSLRGPRPR
jgi:hypothetical protein